MHLFLFLLVKNSSKNGQSMDGGPKQHELQYVCSSPSALKIIKVYTLEGLDRFISRNRVGSVVLTLSAAGFSGLSVADGNVSSAMLHGTDSAIASCQSIVDRGTPTWPVANSDALLRGSVYSEAFDIPQAKNSTRYEGKLTNGIDIVWKSLQTADAPVAMQITASIDQRPHTLWYLNKACVPSQKRQLIYNDAFQAIELQIVDVNDGSIKSTEALNPPVPQASHPGPAGKEGESSSQEAVVRVAMVDSGVNYTLPEINQRLARDDNGEIVGYDFWDNDEQPYDAQFGPSPFHVSRHGTKTASLLLKEATSVELVPYRYPRPAMERMRDLVEHAATNKVAIIGLPLGSNKPDQWQTFAEAARQHPDILFIASAGNNGRNIDKIPVYPAALDLANLLVVTSADDYVIPAEGVNWGRTHVDYMLPAEQQNVTGYSGDLEIASGSSYAVPRAMAMAARWLQDNPNWTAQELVAEFSRRYADGASAKYVRGGYIADPMASDDLSISLSGVQTLTRDEPSSEEEAAHIFKLPLSVFVLNERWTNEQISQGLLQAEQILNQCQISFNSVTISRLDVPEYLQDLDTGAARTLLSALDSDSEFNPIRVFFARDTRMLLPSDGASFARANTRRRPWLQDSVWLMENIEDTGIALAHELFHVLSNVGTHSRATNNLMRSRTSAANIDLHTNQCEAAIAHAKQSLLLFD